MALHLIKLCVGADEVADLARYMKDRTRGVVHTRQTPKRAEEILAGGSLYWVIKGQVLARQTVLAIETLGVKGMARCEIELESVIVLTAPQPRRPFQGWQCGSNPGGGGAPGVARIAPSTPPP